MVCPFPLPAAGLLSVLADVWLPRCSYPAATRDRAVAAYVSGRGTYEAIATEIGVAKSTVWRWPAPRRGWER